MVHRLVRFVVGLGLIAAPTVAVATPAVASYAGSAQAVTGTHKMHVTKVFSPNGDGRRDQAAVDFTLPGAASVKIVIVNHYPNETVRIAKLGRLAAGKHTWDWDGLGGAGEPLEDDRYTVNVRASGWYGATKESAITRIDTQIGANVIPRETWAGTEGTVQKVYPRATVIDDSVALRPVITEPVRWARFFIKDSHGRTVFEHDVSDSEDTGGYRSPDYGVENPDDVAWTALRHGRALPPGRYRAQIEARDRAGNIGRTAALGLYVSRDELEWRDASLVATATETSAPECGTVSDGAGCGDWYAMQCGTVAASAVLPGGLSHRAGECASPTLSKTAVASSFHYLPIPEAVRGIASAKVGFSGRPTIDGESDPGTIYLRPEDYSKPGVTASSSTTAETAWVDCPLLCEGRFVYDETIAPGVGWYFATTGSDAFEVGTFTVTARFLVVAD